MFYITVMQSPIYHQMSLEEFLFQTYERKIVVNENISNTKTYERETISDRLMNRLDISALIEQLVKFNESTSELRGAERTTLYTTFHIPKKSGGLRRIDAPKVELMDALRRLKVIFEEQFHVLHHTAAFAYIKNRSTIDAIKRHQQNESKWFGKYDLSNFFGTTTLDFTIQQLGMIFPFCEIMKKDTGRQELRKAIELAFLDGGLPQGTPVSPLLTNLIMIPVDFKLANKLRDFNRQSYVYTRYADDFIVSSKYTFDVRDIERTIMGVLLEFNAPFALNGTKTRYGSSSGRNWNLGVMLNKDNEITVGHKRKRQFQSMIHNYILDRKNGKSWKQHDVQILDGYYNYYKMVEKESMEGIIKHINTKMNVNVLQYIREDLRITT